MVGLVSVKEKFEKLPPSLSKKKKKKRKKDNKTKQKTNKITHTHEKEILLFNNLTAVI